MGLMKFASVPTKEGKMLSQGEAVYRAIFEYGKDGIFVCRLTEDGLPGKLVEVNTGLCDQLGYSKAEMLTLTLFDLVVAGDQLILELQDKLAQEKQLLFEIDCKTKNGQMVPIEIKAHLVELSGETLFIGIGRDVVCRRQAEADLIASEAKIRQITDSMLDVVAMVDTYGRIEYISPSCTVLLGYTPEEMLGKLVFNIVHPYDYGRMIKSFRALLGDGLSRGGIEFRCLQANGNYVWVETVGRVVYNSAGEICRVTLATRNIQARKEAEDAYKVCEAQNQALINALPDTLFRISRDGMILEFRAGLDDSLFHPNGEFIGKHISEILPRRVAGLTLHYIEKAFISGTLQTYDYELVVNGNHKVWEVRLVISGPLEVLAIVRDITETKEQERRLKYLSLHDSLTGIYNRAFIEQEMYRIQQECKGPVGIIMCDVDRLKQVNDTLGHSSGDTLLVFAANVIKKAVRKGDIVARIGGDEFAILLPQGDLAAARSIYERIQEEAAHHNEENPHLPVSMSVGYAACSDASLGIAELLRQADLNMYHEKMLRGRI